MCRAILSVCELITGSSSQATLVIGLEMPVVYGNRGDSVVKIGDIRGMLMLSILEHYVERDMLRLRVYPGIRPKSAKAHLAGDGNATKAQMVAMAKSWYKDEKAHSEDEADALGIALVAYNNYKAEERRKQDGKKT